MKKCVWEILVKGAYDSMKTQKEDIPKNFKKSKKYPLKFLTFIPNHGIMYKL